MEKPSWKKPCVKEDPLILEEGSSSSEKNPSDLHHKRYALKEEKPQTSLFQMLSSTAFKRRRQQDETKLSEMEESVACWRRSINRNTRLTGCHTLLENPKEETTVWSTHIRLGLPDDSCLVGSSGRHPSGRVVRMTHTRPGRPDNSHPAGLSERPPSGRVLPRMIGLALQA